VICTSVIIWQAWTWSGLKTHLVRSGSSANRKLGSLLLNYRIAQKCNPNYPCLHGTWGKPVHAHFELQRTK
jgi:hypothetical protein